MNVKILGTGCPKCIALAERVKQVAAAHDLAVDVEKVTELDDIMAYGVMMTPGLVIDGNLKSSGKLPSEEQIAQWLL